MPTSLPSSRVRSWSAEMVPRPAEAASAFGTNRQRFVRLGQHWRFTVELPAMNQTDALAWTPLTSLSDTVVWDIPQGSLQAANEGSPRVNLGGQLGNSLDVDGITTGYTVKQGAFVSVITGGRRYVYQVTAQAVASGTGEATLQIQPPLRVAPANDDVVEIASPKVEGYATPDPLTIGLSFVQDQRRFAIEERS